MKRFLSAAGLALAAIVTLAVPAAAQDSRTYFSARPDQRAVPPQLSPSEREYYSALFTAIERERWAEAQQLLAQRSDGPLQAVAIAEYYLAANSPRVELAQIEAWLPTGTMLPQAQQLVRLGQTRGLSYDPGLPYPRELVRQPTVPRRTRPRSVEDGTMPPTVQAAILERITNDDPDGARLLLDGVDASLSSESRAEWRQRVAWSYFIENQDPAALALAQTVGQGGSGAWVAEGDWVAGLAAWRLNDCESARASFERSAYGAINPTLRAAALYWASRSALRCRQPALANDLLEQAATLDETLYGMLSSEALGRRLPDRVESADFSTADWAQIGNLSNVRVAVALTEIGRANLASEILMHQARIGDTRHYEPLSRLARTLGFPQTQLYMAYNAPSGTAADPASHYPAPTYQPLNGWQVDPALAFAHILQESNFRPDARSPADAQGLMQITPITVRQHAPSLNMNAGSVDIYDPQVNLAFGQRNLQMLRDDPTTHRRLPVIMAAYNAGLTPVRRWEYEINDFDDPLLYMEAIPYWETRGYVAIVMRNYWMYERQANAASPSRLALAQNGWPQFPDATEQGSGRVYMSSGDQ